MQLATLFVFVLLGSATDVYLGQSSQGAGDGSSCSSSRAYTYFNSAGNWGSGASQIGPGTIVHLCGTIIESANVTALAFQSGGSSGNRITVKFEPGASLQAPSWPSPDGAIKLRGYSHVLIDGNHNGFISATGSGSGKANTATPSTAISISGSSNVEIRNLRISDLYTHTDPADISLGNVGLAGCVYANGLGDAISIHGNYFSDVPWCITIVGATSTGVEIYENVFWRYDHGVTLALGSSTHYLRQVTVRDNIFSDTANWDTSTGKWHHDGIHAYNFVGGDSSNWTISGNLFDGDWGAQTTSQIYIEAGVSSVTVSGNVFRHKSGSVLAYGMLLFGTTTATYVASRNSFLCDAGIGSSIAAYPGGSGGAWTENVFSACQTYVYVRSGVTVASADRNVYAGSAGGGNGKWNWQTAGKTTLAEWQAASGVDAASSSYADSGDYSSGTHKDLSARDRSQSISFTDSATGRKVSISANRQSASSKLRVHFGASSISDAMYCEALVAVRCFSGSGPSGNALDMSGISKYQIRHVSLSGQEIGRGVIVDL